ncbi:MAG: QueT transporter family protein [Oscillibacter sp.]|nr:QueT transporter family protein [Oscillibacter sp.]
MRIFHQNPFDRTAATPGTDGAAVLPAPRLSTRYLAASGVIAALYAGLTLVLPVPAYGGIQFRAAEAMTVLPWLFPEAIPGLAVGCFLVNLLSPFALDCVFGTLATLLAALWTARVKHMWAAPIPPVVCNAVIVGAEIAWYAAADGERFLSAWALNGLTVGLGEAAACGILGLLLLRALTNVLPAALARMEARKSGSGN